MNPSDQLVRHVLARSVGRAEPLVVAIDGRSGVGKSTLATSVGSELNAVVIEGDDFYAGGDAEFWDASTAAEKAAHGIDWRRQRPVLADLRAGRRASWQPFDWEAFDGSLAETPITADPASVIILEGAYSARPELSDLIDVRVLVVLDEQVRMTRLIERDGEHYNADWDARWRSAEDHYFDTVVPRRGFDLVLEQPTA